jgi:hypothetical protein
MPIASNTGRGVPVNAAPIKGTLIKMTRNNLRIAAFLSLEMNLIEMVRRMDGNFIGKTA